MSFVIDWNLVCLVCLQENEGNMQSLYTKDENDNMLLSEKIMKCTDISIDRNLNIPHQICAPCLKDLHVTYRFRKSCEMSCTIYKQFVKEEPQLSENIIKIPPWLLVKRVKKETVEEFADVVEMEQHHAEAEELPPILSDEITNELNETADYYESKIVEEDHTITSDEFSEDAFVNTDADVEPEEYVEEEEEEYDEQEYENVEILQVSKRARGRPRVSVVSDLDVKKIATKTNKKVEQSPDKKSPKICELCGNSYKYQHALDNHMRRHRNEKPFQCDFCEKAFVANVELRRHMRVHTGQKPYSCKFCERKFSDFGNRIKHERTHTGERPYVCLVCGKAFAYAHVLTVHNLTHTGEKKYKCNLCGRGFTKKAYLETHYANHETMRLRLPMDSGFNDNVPIVNESDYATAEEIYVLDQNEETLEVQDGFHSADFIEFVNRQ